MAERTLKSVASWQMIMELLHMLDQAIFPGVTLVTVGAWKCLLCAVLCTM